ncbi:MAG: ABC transporter ATP-binding protein [Clostridia bacterium]|nr:ABC transporter ATP-binding protein [Clostridia bacterium]
MGKLFRFMKIYKWPALLVVVFTFVQAISQLYLPNLMSDIVNEGVMNQDIAFILKTGGIMLIFTLIVSACTVIARYFASRVSVGMAKDIRGAIFSKVTNYSLHEFDKIGTASLITRSTNDVTQLLNVYIMMLTMLLAAPITAIGGVILALGKDVQLSWIIVVVVAIMAILIGAVASKAIHLFKSLQLKIDKVNLVLRESLTGIRVVRAFNKKEYEINRFDGANKDLTDTSIKVYKLMGLLIPSIMLIMNLTTVAIIWFGSMRINSGDLLIGDMMAFQQYAMQIMMSLIMATMMFVMLPRASASAKRINEILDMEAEIKDPVNPENAGTQKGYVEFKNVCFRFHGASECAVKDISFSAKPGETTAIIGGTGSGKTTLINLITRFYDAQEGEVLVDGVNVRNMTQEELRSKIGFVPQKINLFHGTIAENIRYGKDDATEDEIVSALETAQAMEFVSELEDGINSKVAQGGTNYSGGQKQRLSIARALVRKPEIYIFDDSFSALDFKTDARLRKALEKDTKNATVFIIAQRVSTVMNANRIIVMDNGRVAGQGTHKELLENNEIYKEIVSSQLSVEELQA